MYPTETAHVKPNSGRVEAPSEWLDWDEPWSESDGGDGDIGRSDSGASAGAGAGAGGSGGGGLGAGGDGGGSGTVEVRAGAGAGARVAGGRGWKCGDAAPDVARAAATKGANGGGGKDSAPKDGLTPDWIIDAGCRVFGLALPTVKQPIIMGLLDPCTNNKRRPNIPAEKTFDKRQDGLKQGNEWKGFYVILNPAYESQVQWRFINRAINGRAV